MADDRAGASEPLDAYARYMRVDELLGLQVPASDRAHRDELLFQVAHQSTELWLRVAVEASQEAVWQMRSGEVGPGELLIHQAADAIRTVTGQLDMFAHLSPTAFAVMRPRLGTGSGAQSPGWVSVGRVGRELAQAFDQLCAERGVSVAELYRWRADQPIYRLAERMLDWDEAVALWRMRHYLVAARLVGDGAVGTQGTPVGVLARLTAHRYFPGLWAVRTAVVVGSPASLGGTA
ncbi:tryptophan 2,3-dioxygenase family protein [Micromonospora nigra]|uniref:tryptophan 2,3-dioxygenase family protein n=1 Tax=Micromonospora nigra TaxID=145857 RepID=UPI0024804606|nr:tryptophan 2,3-dioxygenase family protein [Micromonospora nigra]